MRYAINSSQILSKNFKTVLITLIMLAVTMHLFFLDYHPLSQDELLTLDLFQLKDSDKILDYLKSSDTQQPIYYQLMFHFLNWDFINSIFLIRLPSLIFYLIGTFVHYNTVKLFKGKDVALISTTLLSFSFILLFHSTEVRMYSLLFLLLICAEYCFFSMWKNSQLKIKYLAPFIIFGFAATFTHFFGLIYFLTQSFVLLFRLKSYKNKKVIFAIWLLMMIFIIIFVTPFISKNFNTHHIYRNHPSIIDFMGVIAYLFSGTYFIISLLITTLFLQTFRNQIMSLVQSYWMLLVLILFPIGLTFIKSIITAPAFEARYLIGSVSPFYLFVSIYISESKWKLRYFGEVIIILLVLVSLYHISMKEDFFNYPYRLDTKGISRIIIEEKTKHPTLEIISCNTCPRYYLKNLKITCVWENSHPSLELDKNFDTFRPILLIENTYPVKKCERTKKRLSQIWPAKLEKMKSINFYTNFQKE